MRCTNCIGCKNQSFYSHFADKLQDKDVCWVANYIFYFQQLDNADEIYKYVKYIITAFPQEHRRYIKDAINHSFPQYKDIIERMDKILILL